jgi:hypothetical protein
LEKLAPNLGKALVKYKRRESVFPHACTPKPSPDRDGREGKDMWLVLPTFQIGAAMPGTPLKMKKCLEK